MINNSRLGNEEPMLYNAEHSQDSCGVGFITHKQTKQTHDLLVKSHEALCTIPHRGGMSAERYWRWSRRALIYHSSSFARSEHEHRNHIWRSTSFSEDHDHYDSAANELVDRHFKANLPIILWRNVL
jgi:glutamate synthase (NADPH/NADH) large chain